MVGVNNELESCKTSLLVVEDCGFILKPTACSKVSRRQALSECSRR